MRCLIIMLKDGKCYKNYEPYDLEDKVYYKCLNTDEDGTSCEKCADGFEVGEDGLCVNLDDCEEKEKGVCNKCKTRNYEDNLLCANKDFGCVETMTKHCLRCDDSNYLYICTECNEENYRVEKNIKNTTDRLELSKYCPRCQKHTIHKEKK